MTMYSFEDGSETRVVSLGTNPDGSIYVRQTSNGDITQFAFGSTQHTETITFRPTETYGMDDVRDDIESRGGEFFIDDVADSLRLWDVPFRRESSDSTTSESRPAQSNHAKS